jgi:import receptor subunit TOM70
MSDALGAKADLEKSLDIKPDLVQSWVKIASVHMELGMLQSKCSWTIVS